LTGESPSGDDKGPLVPTRTNRLPILLLWFVPFLLIIIYMLVVLTSFHAQAHWTGDRLIEATILLLTVNAAFSVVWFSLAYVASILLGEYVAFGILHLIAKFPGLNRHVVVTPPRRPDSVQEVWGRFGILLLIALGFELIFLLLIVHQGDLAPSLAVARPVRFFPDEAYAGIGLALLLAPAAPFLGSRLRTRITDSLEFPLLWLAVLLIAVGGSSVLLLEVLPGFVFSPALFFTSILLYAPAAWYVCLAFSATEARAQQRFLRRAWKARGDRFHFGRLHVTDEPEGSTTDV
jgi:hypothetical protein